MKKAISLLLVLMLCIGALTVPAAAADASGTCGENLTWTFSAADGTLTISGTGMTDWTYVEAFDFETGEVFTNAPWSEFHDSIRTVVIGEGVTRIGGKAFLGCKALTEVKLPDTLEGLGDGAFESCTALERIHLPQLTSIITAPATGEWNGTTTFCGCSALKEITVDADHPYYTSIDGVLFRKYDNGEGATTLILDYFPNGKTGAYVIPDGAQVWGRAFDGCTLTSITLPGTMTIIPELLFFNCAALKSAVFRDGFPYISGGMFANCAALEWVAIPDSVTSISYQAFPNCEKLRDVYFGGSEAQWSNVSISEGNVALANATIHFNSTGPAPEPTPQPTPAPTAKVTLSPQKLTVDGVSKDVEKYNIDGSNYFMLRDLAYMLNGTAVQFSVGWDSASKTVTITTGEPYAPNGSEMVVGADKSNTANLTPQQIIINGIVRDDLPVYNIGDHNFFKLRDLGEALGFFVDYDEATNTAVVESHAP